MFKITYTVIGFKNFPSFAMRNIPCLFECFAFEASEHNEAFTICLNIPRGKREGPKIYLHDEFLEKHTVKCPTELNERLDANFANHLCFAWAAIQYNKTRDVALHQTIWDCRPMTDNWLYFSCQGQSELLAASGQYGDAIDEMQRVIDAKCVAPKYARKRAMEIQVFHALTCVQVCKNQRQFKKARAASKAAIELYEQCRKTPGTIAEWVKKSEIMREFIKMYEDARRTSAENERKESNASAIAKPA